MSRGQGDLAMRVRVGAGRRGYSTAFGPTFSPANTTTSTNDSATTASAVNT